MKTLSSTLKSNFISIYTSWNKIHTWILIIFKLWTGISGLFSYIFTFQLDLSWYKVTFQPFEDEWRLSLDKSINCCLNPTTLFLFKFQQYIPHKRLRRLRHKKYTSAFPIYSAFCRNVCAISWETKTNSTEMLKVCLGMDYIHCVEVDTKS